MSNISEVLPQKRDSSENENLNKLEVANEKPQQTEAEIVKKPKLDQCEDAEDGAKENKKEHKVESEKAKHQKKLEKKAAKELKKNEKQEKKEGKKKKGKKSSGSSENEVHSPKIKPKRHVEEIPDEEEEYTPSDEQSNDSVISILSDEEQIHGDMEDFDLEEYQRFKQQCELEDQITPKSNPHSQYIGNY